MKKTPAPDEEDKILADLEKLLADASIEVRYEKGEFVGGLYRYYDKQQIVINKALPAEQKIRIIAKELQENVDLNSIYLVPALREVIENASRME